MTDDDYAYRWQADAHRILGKLISEGRDNSLPPLMWTLATTGALTGEAPGLGGDADQRAAVNAWARHLNTTVTETPRNDGRTSLYAPFSRDGKRWGALRAEIFPGLEEKSPGDGADSA